ncbi:MAG: hypothetical protein ABFD64_05015 [Armatimonadota bacterium]
MARISILRRVILAASIAVIMASMANAETSAGLRKRLAVACSSISDLKGNMVVHPASKGEAKEISKGILEFLDHGFRDVSVSYKRPDKFRAQGKAKGVDVTYVLNGNKKQITAPSIMLKKTDDLSRDRAKKQTTLDLGFASDSMWRDNNVKLIAESKGIATLQLIPKGTDDKRKELVWIETKTLKVVKRERYKGDGRLKSRNIYTGHKMIGKVPVATYVKVYSADGGYAGAVSIKDLRANTGLPNSMFAIK